MAEKTGRNDPCPCGSGKKYKKCCLEKDREAESAALKAQKAAVPSPVRPSEFDGDDAYDAEDSAALEDEDVFEVDWPLDPALEHLGGHLDAGRLLAAEERWEEALGEWLPAWEEILLRSPGDAADLDGLERTLGLDWSVLDLVYEVDRGLGEAGRTAPIRHERRRAFCDEIAARFPDSDPLFLMYLHQGAAESLFGLGRVDEGEGRFRALTEAHPDDVMAYLRWGDMYGLHRMSDAVPEDLDRAVEIYQLGMTRVGSGHGLLRERIAGVRHHRLMDERPPRAYLEDEDIAALVATGDQLPDDLWGRLVGRGAGVVPMINGLLSDALWIDDALSDPEDSTAEAFAWGLAHAAYLAARIGDPSSVPALLEMADICEDDDWLHSGHPWFPTRFGAASVEAFLRFCLDPTRAFVVRAGFADGLVWAGGLFPETRPALAAAFADAIASGAHDAEDLTAWLMYSGARIDDEAVQAAIRAAGDRGAFDEGMFGPLEEHLESPRDWYLGGPPNHEDDESYRSGLPGA
ncbi:MAG: SEC-C metal-binding domain-containing protein [Pseudomonadota bacterium]